MDSIRTSKEIIKEWVEKNIKNMQSNLMNGLFN